MRRDYSFDFDDEVRQTSSTHRLNMHPVIEPEPDGPMFSRGQKTGMMLQPNITSSIQQRTQPKIHRHPDSTKKLPAVSVSG